MKNRYVLSGIIGSGFFAVPYLALNFGLLPSLGVGALAFGAAAFATKETDLDKLGKGNFAIYKALLIKSGEYVRELKRISKLITDKTIRDYVNDIASISAKITNSLVISNKQSNFKQIFFKTYCKKRVTRMPPKPTQYKTY